MSSIGFGALKTILINNAPFSEMIEHGLEEDFFEGAERHAYTFIKDFKYEHDKYPEITTIEVEVAKTEFLMICRMNH